MMTKIDNTNTGNLGKLERRVAALERSLSLASSSVERGRMRFYDGSELLIQDSNLNVVGTATIRGTLRADGTIAFTGTLTQSGPSTFTGDTSFNGPTHIAGDFDVTGPTKLNGKTDIGGNTTVTGDLGVKGPLDVTGLTKLDGKTSIGGDTTVTGKLDVTGPMATKGTLAVEGKTTLKNDLDVTSGGKIKAGNVEIEPGNGGQINFLNGGITSDGFGMGIVNTLGIQLIANNVSLPGVQGKAGSAANVHMDSAGRLWRVP